MHVVCSDHLLAMKFYQSSRAEGVYWGYAMKYLTDTSGKFLAAYNEIEDETGKVVDTRHVRVASTHQPSTFT